MRKKCSILFASAICISLSVLPLAAFSSSAHNGSSAMAAAINQANSAVDPVMSLMTNITTQFHATHTISASNSSSHRSRKSPYIKSISSTSSGVITVRYASHKIEGPLKNTVLRFIPQHAGRNLNARSDVHIDSWVCFYIPSRQITGKYQYGVLHNIFVYANAPLNICNKMARR